MYILGISALYHDSAAALIKDGEIIAAAQEERFTRKKHDDRIPINAIRFCMESCQIKTFELSYVVFYDDSILTLDRFMKNVLAAGKDSIDLLKFSYKSLFSRKLWVKKIIIDVLHKIGGEGNPQFYMTKHHISHAASAFYPSPYMNSIILTLDGVGEWTTLSIGIGTENKIELKEELKYPHSLGLFYSAFTYFCGFKVNSGDYKFMGLAPYGRPIYYDVIKEKIIDIKENGSFRLNLEYFDYQYGRSMVNEERMAELFEGKGRRLPETEITQREMDIAASVQKITEEIIIKVAGYAKETYGKDIENVCIAGGCGLNCVANGKLEKEHIYKNIWIQPASGDAGGAIGAALFLWYDYLKNERNCVGSDSQKGSYLGPEYTNKTIKWYLDKNNFPYTEYNSDLLPKEIAKLLSQQKVIGLFEGKMEFGPRALGNRSIIADPRSEDMQSRVNLKIKYRESFRPFAPSVLKEKADEYFEMEFDSPYMLKCADVVKDRRLDFDLEELLKENSLNMLPVVNTKRSDIPAVTHVDYSARIQSVDGINNAIYYQIIKEFYNLTGCAVIVNTSFNVRGEPIVCNPKDAYICFMRTDMDILVLGNCILKKEDQPKYIESEDWRKDYELD